MMTLSPHAAALLPGAARDAGAPLRVLQLADHLGYPDGIRHGVTTYLQAVLPRLRANGAQVHACFLRASHPAREALEAAGVTTEFFGLSAMDPRSLWRCYRAIQEFRPHVVVATQMQSTFIARLLRLLPNAPGLVVHIHDMDTVPALVRAVNRLLPQPDLALCVSMPVTITAVEQYSIDCNRTRVIHNGLDLAPYDAHHEHAIERARTSFKVPRDALLIGRVARMYADKRNDLLVRAMPRILSSVPNAVAVFAGEGPERVACENLARTLGVAHAVRFLGQRDDVAMVTAACDVLAITTPEEPFGYTVLEAYAAGRPVVGFATGGLLEIVDHGRTGLLAPADDLDEFTALMVRILTDRALRTELGRNALTASERYSLDVHVATLAQYLALAG